MKIHDISIAISPSMHVYSGDPGVEIVPVSRITDGKGANVSAIHMGTHTGTHVDPPFHFVSSGVTVDCLPLETLIGECLVCEVQDVPVILRQHVTEEVIPLGTERILFKTRNSALWQEKEFRNDFTYLDSGAAEALVDRGVKLIGIDYLSIDQFKSDGHRTHLKLLGSGVVVLEGLDLSNVSVGTYTLVCLPLKIQGGDGAPARAVLMERP